MEKIQKHNPDKLIDLLTERLTFERAGVKLYDAVLQKMRSSSDSFTKKMIEEVQEFRDQEKKHEEWLEEQVRNLGGDAHGKTEMAKLVEVESQGLEKVILDGDPEVPHVFHALLTVELADNAGWELLVQLANEAGDTEAKRAFRQFLHEEEEHLAFVRVAVMEFTKKELLGRKPSAQELPTSP